MNTKQSTPFVFIILLFLSLNILSGCSPVYEIHNRYVPPPDEQGRQCIQGCQTQRLACMKECDAKEQQCLDEAPANAEAMLQPREKQYLHSLEAYVTEKESYELKLERWKSEREYLQGQYDLLTEQCQKLPNDNNYCKDKKSKRFDLTRHGWKEPRNAPSAPQKPSYATELKHQQDNCKDDCGCNDRYDGCYTSCGGQVDPQRICVENCE